MNQLRPDESEENILKHPHDGFCVAPIETDHMAIDHYSPCPCGSGKKLKFCKCVDQPQDLEKIVKLIEGGQGVAAVDRINQLLAETPNAAWLLAIKGELALGLQEPEMFKETANRFLKLKPDNPLALIMKSIVASSDNEPPENAARYLLEGMSESRESLPSLTLTAIKILVRSLAASGKTSLVGYWSDVLSALSGDEGPEGDSDLLNPTLNLIAKAPARVIDDPPTAEWKERLAEVLTLARTFRYAQAESKLRLILRDFPDQPGPLSHLLRAQCAQLDQSGAVTSAKKLSSHLDLSPEDRAYFAAVALELESEQKSLQTEMVVRYCSIDSEDSAVEALAKLANVDLADGEGLEQAKAYYGAIVQDEVPAKRLYNVFSQPLESDTPIAENQARVIANSVATIVLYGRQTDKPARALVIANKFAGHQALLDEAIDCLNLGDEIPDISVPVNATYSEFLRRPRIVVGQPGEQLTLPELGAAIAEDFLNLPMSLFEGATPLEVASDEKTRADLLSLLYHLEGEQGLVVEQSVLVEIYSRLQLERPTVKVDSGSDKVRLVNILDMDRIDPKTLNDGQLKGMLIQSMSYGASRVFLHCAEEVVSRESMASDAQVRVAALSGMLSLQPGVDSKIEVCDQLEAALVQSEAPVGRVIIQRVSLLHQSGRTEEAQQALAEAAQKYPTDPYLMSFLQYATQSRGPQPGGAMGGGDDLAMRMMQNAARPATPAAESEGSGLVLPGQDGGGDSGESKLWLPGS